MDKVAVVKCRTYEAPELQRSISEALQLIGVSLSEFAGKKVLLKPNLISAFSDDKNATTRIAFTEVLIRMMLEAGALVSMGDSPGSYGMSLARVWETTGYTDLAKRTGVELFSFESRGSCVIDGIVISNAAFTFDHVINLPKFKTHSLTVMTGAVKNLFGFVPGMNKTEMHRNHRDFRDFAGALVKIAEIVRPSLTIVDAITAMEGDGPTAGSSRDVGVVVAGRSTYAIDHVLAGIGGIPAELVWTLLVAKERKLIDPSLIEIVGVRPRDVMVKLVLPKTVSLRWINKGFFRFFVGLFYKFMEIRPYIVLSECKRCGTCIRACPAKAIHEGDKKIPVIDRPKCFRCLCCQEVCPYHAVKLKRGMVLRLVKRLQRSR